MDELDRQVSTEPILPSTPADQTNGTTCIDDNNQHAVVNNNNKLTADDFLRIDICGMTYVNLKATFERFPDTLLGNEKRRRQFYVEARDALYFDRNRECFEAILQYYQTNGILNRPPNVSMNLFLNECSFFDLSEVEISKLKELEGYVMDEEMDPDLPANVWLRRIWLFVEVPSSSVASRIFAMFSISIVAISITIFVLETMPMFQVYVHEGPGNGPLGFSFHRNGERGFNNTTAVSGNHGAVLLINSKGWVSLEISCIAWFTFEYVLRLFSSPSKWKFLTSFLNVIDLMSILPYFFTMSLSCGILRIGRLIRIFRIFKLSRHSMGLKVLGNTFKASISELGMMGFFLFLGVMVFSSAMYFAENGQNPMFPSIPDAFWYSIVTMTTVGYGDKSPITPIGQLIGSICAISGVLCVALPVPVIVSNFEFFYKRDQLRDRGAEEIGKLRLGSGNEGRGMNPGRRRSIFDIV